MAGGTEAAEQVRLTPTGKCTVANAERFFRFHEERISRRQGREAVLELRQILEMYWGEP